MCVCQSEKWSQKKPQKRERILAKCKTRFEVWRPQTETNSLYVPVCVCVRRVCVGQKRFAISYEKLLAFEVA